MSTTKNPSKALGDYIAAERKKAGMSAVKLADISRIPRSTLRRIESGAIIHPRPELLLRIADALELPVTALFEHVSYTTDAVLPPYRSYLESRYMKLSPEAIDELEIYFSTIAEREGIRYDQPLHEQPSPDKN